MKAMLVIALTTVVVGHTSAGWFDNCELGKLLASLSNNWAPLVYNGAPQANNWAPQANNWAPQANNWAPLGNNEASKGNNGAAQGDNGGCVSQGLPDNACDLPSFVFSSNGDNYYTFFLIGSGSWFHWGVSNIPGSVLKEGGDIAGYTQLSKYQPLTETKYSRIFAKFGYRAVIYRQTRPIPSNVYIYKDGFDAEGFAQAQGLCGPEAALQAFIVKSLS